MTSSSPKGGTALAIGAGVVGAILVVIAAAIFFGIYLALPELDHFFALILIGVLALILAGVSYFSQALTRDATVQRAATLGFLGMGFVVLFLTVAFDPAGNEPTFLDRLGGLIVLAILLVIAIVGGLWRARGRMQDATRQEHRSAWAQRPAASAFDYPAAGTVPPAGPTPPVNSPPSVPPGR